MEYNTYYGGDIMPWCPKCKDEYREGITTCVDCGCELVDDLSLVSEETVEEVLDYISPAELEAMAASFSLELDGEQPQPVEKATLYVNNDEKAENNITSAYTLLSIGFLGIVGIVLFFLDIIPSNMNPVGKYMTTGIMGSLFILFFVMGIVSLRNFKLFKEYATEENNVTTQIKTWCTSNLNKESIDAAIGFDAGLSEEIKYFGRTQYIKNEINKQYMNLGDDYLSRLIEEIYPDIFENED